MRTNWRGWIARSVTAAQARSFASQSGLVAVKVPGLPDPSLRRRSSPWENN